MERAIQQLNVHLSFHNNLHIRCDVQVSFGTSGMGSVDRVWYLKAL
jgi:hypothetical protein